MFTQLTVNYVTLRLLT